MPRSLIDRLLERVLNSNCPLTEMEDVVKSKVYPPATESVLAKSERQIGFAFPALLRDIYATVGNGGFGPAYGLIGVPGGATDDLGQSVVDLFKAYRRYCRKAWPPKLLPICHFGHCSYYCLDGSRKALPVLLFDATAFLQDKNPWKESTEKVAPSLEHWISAWLDRTVRSRRPKKSNR